MPRRSSSRGSSPRRSTFTAQKPTSFTPAPTMRPPPSMINRPTTTGGGGFLSNIATGMAFGAGSEVGHQAVRGLTGGPSNSYAPVQQEPSEQGKQQQQQQQQQQRPCEIENVDFVNCLRNNSGNIASCQAFLDIFKECEKKIGKNPEQW